MNILVTNYENSGDDVMIFVDDEKFELSATTVELALKEAGQAFTDVYEVKDAEIQYYLFEPLWADQSFVNGARDKADRYLRRAGRV